MADPAAPADHPTTGLVDGSIRTLPFADVGPLAFGCWRLTTGSVAEARTVVEAALGAGMNLVDTADVYGLDWGGQGFGANEEMLGRVLREAPDLRDRMVLATKGGIVPGVPYDASPEHVRRACEASLRRLGVDQVDLWMVHRPDPYTHPEAVAEGLRSLLDRGWVRAVGLSNHTTSQVSVLAEHCDVPVAVHQVELSVLHQEPVWDGTLDQCISLGAVPMAWSPLAGGRLATGDGVRDELTAELDRLAQREGVTPADVAVAFCLAHPSRPVVVVGTQRPERLAQLARATTVRLDRTDVYALTAAAGVPLP